MEPLREPYDIRSIELRTLLGVSAPTLLDLCKKLEIKYSSGQLPERGATKPLSGPQVRKILEARGYSYGSTPKIISFMMCKGGVGKTTSSFYLAQRLSAYGARVLAVDADPQGNLTSAFALSQYGIEIDEETPILVDLITGEAKPEEAVIALTPLLHLIPSTPLNALLDGKIRDAGKNPSLPIKKILDSISDNYDYILIDCAPALNLTNTAAMSASNLVILPVAPDRFSQIGLEQTLDEIKKIESDFENVKIVPRIIFTKFDAREFTSLKYLGEIADQHGDKQFKTAIRTSADVKNAITKQENLFNMKKSNAREDYDAFTLEVMGLDTFFNKSTAKNARADQ